MEGKTIEIIEINIPLQDKEYCDEHNERCRRNFGDNFFPVKSTEEYVDDLIDKVYEMINDIGDEGGYVGDSIKVKMQVEYMPEDK